jgi:hypothetical protein
MGLLNSIDEFTFDDMLGALQPKQPNVDVLVRGGHDGETFRYTGTRAEPSVVQTLRYWASRDDAIDVFAVYNALIDGTGYEVFQHDFSWGLFKVLKIKHLGIEAVGPSTGTIEANPVCLQRIEWTLVSTFEVPTP